eukprot:NODE_188_length_13518_cov_0.721142.p11 type:complete len:127 gc:universal NODE_188_length_13518_cov_0.721142:9825-10205(+)
MSVKVVIQNRNLDVLARVMLFANQQEQVKHTCGKFILVASELFASLQNHPTLVITLLKLRPCVILVPIMESGKISTKNVSVILAGMELIVLIVNKIKLSLFKCLFILTFNTNYRPSFFSLFLFFTQ